VWRDLGWDSNKDLANRRKHGLSFNEAASALRDPLMIILEDGSHSEDEARYIVIGATPRGRLIMLVIVELDPDTARIISARRLDRRERHAYENRSR
jgi:uncharacterized DUF497 family protein